VIYPKYHEIERPFLEVQRIFSKLKRIIRMKILVLKDIVLCNVVGAMLLLKLKTLM